MPDHVEHEICDTYERVRFLVREWQTRGLRVEWQRTGTDEGFVVSAYDPNDPPDRSVVLPFPDRFAPGDTD
jgi:hypothetical protein